MPSYAVINNVSALAVASDSAVYATAQEGGALSLLGIAKAGQSLITGTYRCREWFVDFSFPLLSAIPKNASTDSAVFSVVPDVIKKAGQIWELYYLGANLGEITTDWWIPASELGALTLLATADSTGWSVGTRYYFTNVIDVTSYLDLKKYVYCALVARDHRTGVVPTTDDMMTLDLMASPGWMQIDLGYSLAENAMLVSD